MFFCCWALIPCDETALERAKSILLATMITGRVRIKSKSCNVISSCSTRVNDALSTHEYTNMNASALTYSSCVNRDKQKKLFTNHAHNSIIIFFSVCNQTSWMNGYKFWKQRFCYRLHRKLDFPKFNSIEVYSMLSPYLSVPFI